MVGPTGRVAGSGHMRGGVRAVLLDCPDGGGNLGTQQATGGSCVSRPEVRPPGRRGKPGRAAGAGDSVLARVLVERSGH